MAIQKNVTCPSCGKTITVDADASELFCTYCGTRFEALQEDEGQRLREAFDEGDYALVVERTGEGVFERDRALGMLRSAAEFFLARESYFKAARELADKRKATSALSKLFTGKDEYTQSPIHAEWFDSVEKMCGALAEQSALCVGGANEPLARALALKLTRTMLEKKSEKIDGLVYWPGVAVEHFCLPLVPFIETESLRELCENYGSYYKRYDRLPNQEKVLAELKKELSKR